MTQQKYYVVWSGREIGIFKSWDECKRLIAGYPNAVYKSFPSLQLAEEAYKGLSEQFIGDEPYNSTGPYDPVENPFGYPLEDSISVDGAWNTVTGVAEYQGVHTKTGEVLFRKGPFQDGTNNIVEYVAVVNALHYCQQNKLTLPIYSDSKTAISWVHQKKAKTNHKRSNDNKELFKFILAADTWLSRHDYENQILKWETAAWGENPADFGRK